MSIALVQSVQSSFASVSNKTVTITASTPGNLLVALFLLNDANITITGMDDGTNTYTAVSGSYVTSALGTCTIWASPNTLSVTTVNAQFSPNAAGRMVIAEFSGVKTTSPVDDGQHATVAADVPKGPVLTGTNSGDLFLTIIDNNASIPTGVTAPWALLPNISPAGIMAYLINPGSTGTQQAIFTPATSDAYLTSGAAFLPAPAAPTTKKWSTELVF